MRALVLEDNEFDAGRLKRDLRAIDPFAQVTRAETCSEFENFATSRHYDVLIVDYFVPDGDGLSALKAISHHMDLSKMTVIMIVGMYQDRVAAEAEELGCFAYLAKSELKVDRLRSLLFHQENSPTTTAETVKTVTATSPKTLAAAHAFKGLRSIP